MGGVNSKHSLKVIATKAERKITSPELKDNKLSLEAFIAEIFEQLVEKKVEEIIMEERRKTSAITKNDEGVLEVLDSSDEFFRSALAKDEIEVSDTVSNQAEIQQSDNEVSGGSGSPSPSSTTSSSPIEGSSEVPSPFSPDGIPPNQITGLIVNIPSRMVPFFNGVMEFFWNLRILCKPGTFEKELKILGYPPQFSNECVEIEDVELCRTADQMRFMNRALFFDFVREILQRIYEGEDEDIQNGRQPTINSYRYRLWLGTKRPNSFKLLERIVRANLETDFGITLTLTQDAKLADGQLMVPSPALIVKDIGNLPRLTQWTLKQKNWLNQLLEVEMRADDPNWVDYGPFEKAVMNSLTAKILAETFDGVYYGCMNRLKRDIFEAINGIAETT